MSTCTTYNRGHLLDSGEISIGPNMVSFLVTVVPSVVYVEQYVREIRNGL